jgi:hypothetical protein
VVFRESCLADGHSAKEDTHLCVSIYRKTVRHVTHFRQNTVLQNNDTAVEMFEGVFRFVSNSKNEIELASK